MRTRQLVTVLLALSLAGSDAQSAGAPLVVARRRSATPQEPVALEAAASRSS